LGCSQPHVSNIELGKKGATLSPREAEALFFETGAILAPYVAFEGTKVEIRPAPHEALGLQLSESVEGRPGKPVEYAARHYLKELEVRERRDSKSQGSEDGEAELSDVERHRFERLRELAQLDLDELQKETLDLVDILLRAAATEGVMREVRNELWRTMEKIRLRHSLDESIGLARRERAATIPPIPVSEIGKHPYFRHRLLRTRTKGTVAEDCIYDGKRAAEVTSFINKIKSDHGSDVMVVFPTIWPCDLATPPEIETEGISRSQWLMMVYDQEGNLLEEVLVLTTPID
jgi:hypothetical protein